jgi:hypothetical protein
VAGRPASSFVDRAFGHVAPHARRLVATEEGQAQLVVGGDEATVAALVVGVVIAKQPLHRSSIS